MENNEKLKLLTYYLTTINGIGNKTILDFLAIFTVSELLETLAEGDIPAKGKIIAKISNYTFDALKANLNKFGISIKCIWENGYPKLLKEIHNPPAIIFYKGEWREELINNSLSIVGTRKVTEYGKRAIRNLVPTLIQKGFGIVSGLATGVDAEAHKLTVEEKGYAIAVLPANVYTSSPITNSYLYKKILDSGGIILSEYNEVEIYAGMFAQRNRIVAGLSKGSIIIEAGEKSGALITANLALESNREVYALPGSVYFPQSIGCNELIKNGKAKLVQDVEDILIDFNITSSGNISTFDLSSLTIDERKVYDILLSGEKNIEEISFDLNIALQTLNSLCSILELKNIIKRNNLGRYQII